MSELIPGKRLADMLSENEPDLVVRKCVELEQSYDHRDPALLRGSIPFRSHSRSQGPLDEGIRGYDQLDECLFSRLVKCAGADRWSSLARHWDTARRRRS